jgi:arylsulfatase A-like enzyme
MAAFRRLYRGEVQYLAREVGRLLARLHAPAGPTEPPVVALFSDHGDAFGEHGLLRHGGPPLAPLVHVPCLVDDPREPARTLRTPVSAVDLVPTLLDAAGLERPPALTGRPLGGLPADGDRTVFAYRGNPEATPYHVTAIDGDRQVVRRLFRPDGTADGTETVYRLGRSTAEETAADATDLAGALDDHLEALAATRTDAGAGHEPSAAVRERLARLGYRDRDL